MLLVIDVGNTNTKVGVCDDTRLLVSWSLTTRREQTADEYGLFVEMLLRTRGVDTRDITGIGIAADALLTRAARLYRVELVKPEHAIGRDTVTNIQSGIVYGFAGLIDGIVGRMRSELAADATVVATGGLASLMADVASSIQHLNADLKLEGLRLIYQRAQK